MATDAAQAVAGAPAHEGLVTFEAGSLSCALGLRYGRFSVFMAAVGACATLNTATFMVEGVAFESAAARRADVLIDGLPGHHRCPQFAVDIIVLRLPTSQSVPPTRRSDDRCLR